MMENGWGTIFSNLVRECLSGRRRELKPKGWKRAHRTMYGSAGCSLQEHLSNARRGAEIHVSLCIPSQVFQHGTSSLERRGTLIYFSQSDHMGYTLVRETVLGTKITKALSNYFFQSHPHALVSLSRLHLRHKWHILYNVAFIYFYSEYLIHYLKWWGAFGSFLWINGWINVPAYTSVWVRGPHTRMPHSDSQIQVSWWAANYHGKKFLWFYEKMTNNSLDFHFYYD